MSGRRSGGLVAGLILIGLGVFFLLDATDTVEFGDVFSVVWPSLLILWGAYALVRERGRSLGGTIVLLLGVGFLLENLDVVGDDWLGRYWPVLLIVLGGMLLLGGLSGRGRRPWEPSERATPGDWVDAAAFMSGRRERVTSTGWRGGRATAFMGGVELDLRDARPVPEGATLRTTAIMGGVEVWVPEDWLVEVRGTPLLGGFEDKTRRPAQAEGAPRLEITGTAIMGGVEVKHRGRKR